MNNRTYQSKHHINSIQSSSQHVHPKLSGPRPFSTGHHTVRLDLVTKELYFLLVWVINSDWDPDLLWKRVLIHISGGLDSLLIFIKHFLSLLKISYTFVFFLRTSGEYSKKYRQGSIISTWNLNKFWNLLLLITMTNLTYCKTQKLNEWCSFQNDKSNI